MRTPAYCPGPFDYGDLVLTHDGRYGEVHGYGSPPLEYTVGFTFNTKNRLSEDRAYISPARLQRVLRADRWGYLDH